MGSGWIFDCQPVRHRHHLVRSRRGPGYGSHPEMMLECLAGPCVRVRSVGSAFCAECGDELEQIDYAVDFGLDEVLVAKPDRKDT